MRLFSKLLNTRIKGIMKQCCLEFRKGRLAAMVNGVSGARFTAKAEAWRTTCASVFCCTLRCAASWDPSSARAAGGFWRQVTAQ
jgi:hypothetical protein